MSKQAQNKIMKTDTTTNQTQTNQTTETATGQVEHKLTPEAKQTAIIAYITVIGLIVAFIMNNNKKAAFSTYHIKQSLGLALTGLALGIVGVVPILGWIVSFLGSFGLLYLWIMGLVNAINGKQEPVPWLGEKYDEWFKNI